jgi:hypothetical protein
MRHRPGIGEDHFAEARPMDLYSSGDAPVGRSARFAVACAWDLEYWAIPLGCSPGRASARPEGIEGGAEDLS